VWRRLKVAAKVQPRQASAAPPNWLWT
jgi:hypothetical protein